MDDSSPSAAGSSSLSISLHACTSGPGRVAVLGGSFDPITTGHLKVACEIVHTRKADEVWIVPCGSRPDKPSLKTPYMHRLLMCHLAVNTTFGSTFPIRVCDIEMAEAQALSTYHLMDQLRREYPEKEFVFVIGLDNFDQLKSWTAPGVPNAGERLFASQEFLLMMRPGYELPANLPSNFHVLAGDAGTTIVTEEVSSSEIRRRLKPTSSQFGENERDELEHGHFNMVDGLLTPAVLAHIIRYGLYVSSGAR